MSAVERAWALSSSRLHFSGRWHESDLLDLTILGSCEAAWKLSELGRAAAKRIPTLIEFPDLGHGPQIQAPVSSMKLC
jgi:pimeloyl-ACP methyl ester carboxylesterase